MLQFTAVAAAAAVTSCHHPHCRAAGQERVLGTVATQYSFFVVDSEHQADLVTSDIVYTDGDTVLYTPCTTPHPLNFANLGWVLIFK